MELLRASRVRSIMRMCAVGLVLLFATVDEPAKAETEAPTEEQIRNWVSDLSSERYSKRTSATKNLITAGLATIDPLMEGISEFGLEVTTRGIYVLQQLAVARDEATEAAARAALDKIAAARVTMENTVPTGPIVLWETLQ